jgi:predicted transcriptional regulator
VHNDTASRICYLAELGFSQDRIAKECGLSQPTISSYVRKEYKVAREDVAARVQAAYDRLLAEHRQIAA